MSIRYKYDIYKDNQLVAKSVPCAEVAEITGVSASDVYRIARNPWKHNGYVIKISGQMVVTAAPRNCKTVKGIPEWWKISDSERWEAACEPFRRLKNAM